MLDKNKKSPSIKLMFEAYLIVFGVDFLVDSGSTSFVAQTFEILKDCSKNGMIVYFKSPKFVRKQV